jgi:nitronate monooxygenase
MGDDIEATRSQTRRPFGVNVFSPPPGPSDGAAVEAYAERLAPEARRAGVELGAPRSSDDEYDDKLERLRDDPVAVVSFTFGCPEERVVRALQAAGTSVWVTVTTPAEARDAARAGADALVVQGAEAGGHRGSFSDDPERVDYGLLALLQLVRRDVELPLVATGGIATGRGVAAVLAAGASAAALGTAFMLCDEAATAPAHREAIAADGDTALTRAFTGRTARGIANRFLLDHSSDAPSAYPDVHHVTSPLRAAARDRSDPDLLHLWAGQAHALVRDVAAGAFVEELGEGARRVLREVRAWLAEDRELARDRERLVKICCAPRLPVQLQSAPRPARLSS